MLLGISWMNVPVPCEADRLRAVRSVVGDGDRTGERATSERFEGDIEGTAVLRGEFGASTRLSERASYRDISDKERA